MCNGARRVSIAAANPARSRYPIEKLNFQSQTALVFTACLPSPGPYTAGFGDRESIVQIPAGHDDMTAATVDKHCQNLNDRFCNRILRRT